MSHFYISIKYKPNTFNDPIFKLKNKYYEIKNDSNIITNYTKELYFNKDEVHSGLYENDDIIEIDDRLKGNLSFSFLFYLVLLIRDKPDITNYIYSLDYIKKIHNNINNINNLNIINNNDNLYNLFKSKIILELLKNYKGIEIYEENPSEEKKIEDENILSIKNNIRDLERNNINLNLNDIMEKNIDEIYINIIISLIKNDKLSEEIISELEIKNIDLTKNMLEELKKEFTKDKDYLQKYKISNFNDLSNNEIINFYYMIIKCILKNPIYIYIIPFLEENRTNLLKILKSKNFQDYVIPDENLKNKVDDLIKLYSDSLYYYDLYTSIIEIINNKVNENEKIKNNSEGKINSTNEGNAIKSTAYVNELKQNEQNGQNNNENNLKEEKNLQRQILNNFTVTLHTNKSGEEPFFIFDKTTIGKQKINITNLFLKMKKRRISDFSDINFQKFMGFLAKLEEKLKNEYKHDYCLRLNLQFKNENDNETINQIINNNKDLKYNIACKYTFYDPIENKDASFKSEKILENNPFESEGFTYLLEEINNDYYKKIKYEYKESENINSENNTKKVNSKLEINRQMNDNISFINNYYSSTSVMKTKNDKIDIDCTASKEEIISFIKVINQHRKSAKFFGQLKNGIYLSYGGENSIFIYGKDFELMTEIKNLDDSIYNVLEKKSQNTNTIELIACCNKNLNLISINKRNYQYNIKQYQIPDVICLFCCEMNDNYFIISGESIVVGFNDLFEAKKFSKSHKFIQKTYRSGININNKIAALTSNSLVKNGEDSLIICNIEKKQMVKKITGFSHVYDPNGLASLCIGDKIILLSACKKYFPNQNNGILIVNNPLGRKDEIKEEFISTESFEVNCICPLYSIQNDKNNIQKNPTNLFMAGGFDSEKGEGIIQLYRISQDNEGGLFSIEYLQDIEYEYSTEFHGFEMTVSCIKQTDNGNIIISCIDGNIYLFSKPNLEFYLQESYF